MSAGFNRSGTANTTSKSLTAAWNRRRRLEIQNIGTANLGINEFGGTAALGSPGTQTLQPGQTGIIYTNNAVTVIAAAGNVAYTAVEL